MRCCTQIAVKATLVAPMMAIFQLRISTYIEQRNKLVSEARAKLSTLTRSVSEARAKPQRRKKSLRLGVLAREEDCHKPSLSIYATSYSREDPP